MTEPSKNHENLTKIDLFFEIRPIPRIKPRIIAIKNEISVEPNVTFKPGIIKLKAFRYSSPVAILKII